MPFGVCPTSIAGLILPYKSSRRSAGCSDAHACSSRWFPLKDVVAPKRAAPKGAASSPWSSLDYRSMLERPQSLTRLEIFWLLGPLTSLRPSQLLPEGRWHPGLASYPLSIAERPLGLASR